VIKSFGSIDGLTPAGPLIQVGDFVYGLNDGGYSPSGSPGEFGSIFRMSPDGSDYTILHNFNKTDGEFPVANLVWTGEYLVGTTWRGGLNNSGVLFRIRPDGSDFETLVQFDVAIAGNPSFLTMVDDALYGFSREGGSGSGTLFKVNPDGSGFAVIHEFEWPHRARSGPLLYSDGKLFGISDTDKGPLFSISLDGSGYTVLHTFYGTDGYFPTGQLVCDDVYVYGVTRNKSPYWEDRNGLIFRIGKDGSDFTVLHRFKNSGGGSPEGGLLLKGNTLWGTTGSFLSSDTNLVFKINKDGSDFEIIHTHSSTNTPMRSALSSTGNAIMGSKHASYNQNSGSFFRIEFPLEGFQLEISNGVTPQLSFTGESGLSALIEYFPSEEDTNEWHILERVVLTGNEQSVTDTSFVSEGSRFYRGRVE
jgi:uncharacterized repeat protein (TIGR03803 family)